MTVEETPREGEDVYASLLLTDTYLPGALVLAHSLRDAGTTKKLAILVTNETVSDEVVTQLETVYDYVIPIERVVNDQTPANLDLMNRPDLHSTFSKIHLWRQTQFRKIVYLDADVVAYRAPDELFDLPHAFAAAPDVGWPDLFNSGVMLLTPNIGDYHGLQAMAERGVSFDGADQGLLNMYFKNFHRLSFTYNVTPAAHYTYVPAYRHFQSSINMVHFIGALKPWVQGRNTSTNAANQPMQQMYGRWWAVYDRHYKNDATNKTGGAPDIVRYFVTGEFNPEGSDRTPTFTAWDASKHAPPTGSRGEATNLPSKHYDMSRDTAQWNAPASYPSPPRNLWYEVSKDRPFEEVPRAIFPWEANQPRPTRVFALETLVPEQHFEPEPETTTTTTTEATAAASIADSSATEHDQDDRKSEPESPASSYTLTGPPQQYESSSPWQSFPRTNAWDENPGIERYVDAMQQKQQAHRPAAATRIAGEEAQLAGNGFPERG